MSPPPSPLIHLRVVHHLPWGWWSQTLSGRSIYLFIYFSSPCGNIIVAGIDPRTATSVRDNRTALGALPGFVF